MPILNITYKSEVVLSSLWSKNVKKIILSSAYQHKPSTVLSLI